MSGVSEGRLTWRAGRAYPPRLSFLSGEAGSFLFPISRAFAAPFRQRIGG